MTGSVATVFLFEWRRALTLPRIAWWLVLAGFPVFIIGLIRANAMGDPPREFWASFLFALVPMLLAMLGTLLWTTPAISSELERRSWVYLAVRPHGGAAVLLGKYLAAITWVIPAAIVGVSIAVPLTGTDDGWRIWWAMVRLVCLSCPAYGAVYLVIGTILPRRAMVLAVGYTLIFELIVSFIPAVINKMTVQFRLRALFIEWCDIVVTDNPELAFLFADSPAWHHVAILLSLIPILLSAAVLILRCSEFSASSESDV